MYMPLFAPDELTKAEAIACLVYCNPFLPERIDAERRSLGPDYVESGAVWHASLNRAYEPNLARFLALVEDLCKTLRQRLIDGAVPTDAEARLYEDLLMYALYYRQHPALDRIGRAPKAAAPDHPEFASLFAALVADVRHFFKDVGLPAPDPAHLFACFSQIQRAFDQIFNSIVGTSMAAARLRASIWQSIFTHDMRRYRRTLYDKTGDYATLIVGPSGTGKELVAHAIAVSRYVPFDPRKKAFTEDFAGLFFPLNLSALSPTLVESELFGHRRGAFTGAVDDRPGWLQTCPPLGTVFLDEIGDLDPLIQVKLLRVLQTRTFQRLGDTRTLEFRGKIIAATNRDLAAQMRDGTFRRDLYYRLCSDIVATPSLREQLADSPDELRTLVLFIARRLIPDEADAVTDEVLRNIRRHLGPDYAWPGNFRELEQCVRNVLIRGEYRGAGPAQPDHPLDDLARGIGAGSLTADQLLSHYCAHVYHLAGTYEAAAKRLGMDRRTVRAKVMQLTPVPEQGDTAV
jgi:DNA-binding NtrC family response regulator